jgi:ribosome-binding protein aMBF1 (putative translation factor)
MEADLMGQRTYSPYTKKATHLFAQLIQLKRKERGITQKGLADRVRVSRAMVQRIEAGDPKCEIGVVFEIAFLLGIQLFGEEKTHTTLMESLQDKISLLPASVRESKQEVSSDF